MAFENIQGNHSGLKEVACDTGNLLRLLKCYTNNRNVCFGNLKQLSKRMAFDECGALCVADTVICKCGRRGGRGVCFTEENVQCVR